MTSVNIIIGRFQPITKGHLKCAEYAFKQNGCKTVLCMVETLESKVDERHPFPSDMLVPMYRDLLKSNKYVVDIVLVKNADIVKIAEQLREKHYVISSWACGTDRYPSYKAMADKYAERAGLAENFEVIEIKRTGTDISATKLRDYLKAGDKVLFYEGFPVIPLSVNLKYNIFDTLKTQLFKVLG